MTGIASVTFEGFYVIQYATIFKGLLVQSIKWKQLVVGGGKNQTSN